MIAIGGLTLLTLPVQCRSRKALVIDDEGSLQVVKRHWYILWGETEYLGEVRQTGPGTYLFQKSGTSTWTKWNWESFQQMSE